MTVCYIYQYAWIAFMNSVQAAKSILDNPSFLPVDFSFILLLHYIQLLPIHSFSLSTSLSSSPDELIPSILSSCFLLFFPSPLSGPFLPSLVRLYESLLSH